MSKSKYTAHIPHTKHHGERRFKVGQGGQGTIAASQDHTMHIQSRKGRQISPNVQMSKYPAKRDREGLVLSSLDADHDHVDDDPSAPAHLE